MGKIYDQVLAEYEKYDTELSGNFFDFVMENVTMAELLREYRDLQADINGDTVAFVSELTIMEDNKIISGREMDFEQTMKQYFLDQIVIPNDMSMRTALMLVTPPNIYRIMDAEHEEPGSDRLTGGELLSFLL